ncbi:MAG: amino acid ABC transporter ATP-binding protein [Ruminococcus sp.]|nr:amino acid ABC transporter ATP-binding protein [Candidatus Copronaster equi]
MIRIEHLRKEYPNAIPLKDVNVTINDGDIISVIGPSGTGKSTLIRCINMLDRPTSGKIIVNGTDITDKHCNISNVRKKMGMVFQSFNLFGHLTVLENVMFAPIELKKMPKQEAYDRAIELLRMVGMDRRAMNYPDMLSGGQKQRVAIARTLSMDPDIILFDEPTSALDPTMVGEVQSVIRSLTKMGKTMIIVTHEMKFAREICNRVFYMDDGGIYEDGTPEQIFDNPQKERTRRFIRHLKVFETVIDGVDFDFAGVVSEINQYAYKNDMPPKMVYRLHALFEELCHELLLPAIEQKLINFTVEYDAEAQAATVIITYPGKFYDPNTSNNNISLAIINNLAESIQYSYNKEDDFCNKITVCVK